MNSYINLFNDDAIIRYLCNLRVKKAKSKSKLHSIHLLTSDKRYNYHKSSNTSSEYETELHSYLLRLLPPRKQWIKLGFSSRFKINKDGSKQKLSTNDKNLYALLKTIKYYKKYKPNERFLLELNLFIERIRLLVQDKKYSIKKPETYPKSKNKSVNESFNKRKRDTCRPISTFSLEDRIILSFTNKFLTKLFDPYFEESSCAFRSVKSGCIVNHHTAIQKIMQYKNSYPEKTFYVAEFDMQKFYDSVNHKCIRYMFNKLIKKAIEDNPSLDLSIPMRIFRKYLNCYSFNQEILPLNNNKEYWRKMKIPSGKYGWVEDDLNKLQYYKTIENEKIGIPQGGALSGLIANIVLDYADKKMMAPNLFYVRFCDDMIMMHEDKKICSKKIKLYENTLKKLKLVPHTLCTVENLVKKRKDNRNIPEYSFSPFWNQKSKGPYLWGAVKDGGFPWIGFVGYEIHHNGFIRVRKSSLEKEKLKQKIVVQQIETVIGDSLKCRVNSGRIAESAISRLVGMSVGRFDLWNYKVAANEMCWKKGFQELNNNKYSIKQMKELDRMRSRLFYKLKRDIRKKFKINEREHVSGTNTKRQIIDYNKPFSYYYQILEKQNSENL